MFDGMLSRMDAVNRSLEAFRASPVVPTLLLSSQTPPPVAKPEQMVNFFVATFDPFVFSYCVFDAALILHEARQLGADDLLASPTSLLCPPRMLVRSPSSGNRFGPERLAQLAEVLDALLHEHEASPRSLTYAAQQQQVSCPQLVPFLRGVCLSAEVKHPLTPQVAYVLAELQTNGFASPYLYLDGTYEQRHRLLALLLLSSAEEFGSTVVLYTALELMTQQHEAANAYTVSRAVCRALAKEDKRNLDWALKTRGKPRHDLSARRGWTHNIR
ncbi:hypothetical protein ABB37_05240 [Leptomonas pyrrhocoris]|uniref:Uncharacterized protein n=1 Tax=Leptomonas pyrrhocoris TaxID=157538 RepID=A0A0M9FZZ0_LEPPY|nr:hypothetical protein ABB37_05240 [Leptomonas pyrrhocoris]KPA79389.1 hypothetical protein ABB37_05240 [Leptomonas pyrrhocoris]|eukprot:XP_015657828.1 hypothetical protein ABB37_05240 [Leptomonas pyrrhocoris]